MLHQKYLFNARKTIQKEQKNKKDRDKTKIKNKIKTKSSKVSDI